jgi:hypothetical protein
MRPRIKEPELIRSTEKRKNSKIVKKEKKQAMRAQQRNKRSISYYDENGRYIYIDRSVT